MSDQELNKIANGKYAARLNFLRQNAQNTPPEEFYLLLNPADITDIAEEQFASAAHTLETWRNGLILLPLLITWLSLAAAASAYAQTYALSSDSFLKQWIDGFPKAQLPFPTPSFIHVSIFSAFLLLMLLALTHFTQKIEGNAHKRASQLRIWLDEELYMLASSSLVKSLGEGPDNKQPAWAVEVHTAINHLNQAMKGVEELVNASQKTLTDLTNTSQNTMDNLVQVSQQKLEGSVREFRGAIGDQREAVEEFMKGTIEVRRAVDKLEKIYVEGEHIYQGLNAMLPQIDQSFRTLATRQDAAANALESVSSQTNQATNAIGEIATQFIQTQLVQSTYQAATHMQQTAEVMHTISLHMDKTVERQFVLQSGLKRQARTLHLLSGDSTKHDQYTEDESFLPVKYNYARKSWFTSISQFFRQKKG